MRSSQTTSARNDGGRQGSWAGSSGSGPGRRLAVRPQGVEEARKRLRPGRAAADRGGVEDGPSRPSHQLSEASVSFHVADGRMTAAALAGSGW